MVMRCHGLLPAFRANRQLGKAVQPVVYLDLFSNRFPRLFFFARFVRLRVQSLESTTVVYGHIVHFKWCSNIPTEYSSTSSWKHVAIL